jgi:uncharacterized membrane protein YdfJ with MMPL/SSD domain
MRSLARWCFTHRFRVLAAWVLALVVLAGLSVKAGSGYTDSFSLPGTESTTALNLLTENFNTESTDTNQVVFAADDVNDPATKARIERTLDRIARSRTSSGSTARSPRGPRRTRSPRTARSRSRPCTWTASSRSPTSPSPPTTS